MGVYYHKKPNVTEWADAISGLTPIRIGADGQK
jgi:hypothetical protein